MVIKTFEYTVLNSLTAKNEPLETKSFSLNVAEKAKYIVHRAIKTAAKNRSQFTSSTKTRSEVNGGGRKPWKQKGTGRARAGSKSSPLWKGGGVTFGPKPRDIIKKINKKEKQLALRTLLYNRHNQFLVFNQLEFTNPKTLNLLQNLKVMDKDEKTLIISSKPNKNLQLSIRNLKHFQYILANQLNLTELAKAKQIIIDESSFQVIKETYCNEK
jgi:large subunit ribosomal protein L4|tara:strand:- start:14984 stop:15625 length:642 start_codon:yes stop_codon:yes gene_type:complete